MLSSQNLEYRVNTCQITAKLFAGFMCSRRQFPFLLDAFTYMCSCVRHTCILWSAIRDKNRSCTATRLSRSRYRDSRLANAYSNRVTRTRVLKTRLQIVLRELASSDRVTGTRVFQSRYGNSRLESASSDRVTGTRICKTLIVLRKLATGNDLTPQTRDPFTKPVLLGKGIH